MFPTIQSDLTALRAAMIVLVIPFGYVVHELCHAAVLVVTRTPFSVEIAPSDRPDWQDILIGRAVMIRAEEGVSPRLGIAFALAPGVLALPAVYLWARILAADVVGVSSLLFVAAWFIVFLPSALDWKQAYACLRASEIELS